MTRKMVEGDNGGWAARCCCQCHRYVRGQPRPRRGGGGGRERLLADFGWRFHLGHANDPALDFGYGRGNAFAKSAASFRRRSRQSGDHPDRSRRGRWTPSICRTTGRSSCRSSSDRGANAHGAKPLGRKYPETSVGWYRRTFDIPASDAGRRIAIEFDGVFRDAIVVLNGHYIGRNLSGYAPFRFDVTDLSTRHAPRPAANVLVVRVDATESEGWFYEGAGIYRHVWLVKTAPLHVAQWGTFVTAECRPGAATVSIRTRGRRTTRMPPERARRLDDSSTRAARRSRRSTSAPVVDARVGTADGEQHVVDRAAGAVVARRRRTCTSSSTRQVRKVRRVDGSESRIPTRRRSASARSRFDADKGFFLNGKPVKIKGMCNHQDHAGVGAGLPDACSTSASRS